MARRKELETGQHPFAVILSCADSRVPPELLFDQGLGDMFVIRVAGNVLDDVVLGSIEYAVEHLNTRLIVVLGHAARCCRQFNRRWIQPATNQARKCTIA